jgi:NAD(P)-dependent dehydrogenase (short-subunit alcohol dehydrogenase family)
VLGLTRHLAKEYAAQSIPVNTIAPGPALVERNFEIMTEEAREQLLPERPRAARCPSGLIGCEPRERLVRFRHDARRVPAIADHRLPEAIGEDLVGSSEDGRAHSEIATPRCLDRVLVPLEPPKRALALPHVDEDAAVALLYAASADLPHQLQQRLQREAPSEVAS